MGRSNANQTQMVTMSVLAAVLATAVAYYVYTNGNDSVKAKAKSLDDNEDKSVSFEESDSKSSTSTEHKQQQQQQQQDSASTPQTSNKKDDSKNSLHAQIEKLDKKGKAFFKSKKYLEAAQIFTEALDLIGDGVTSPSTDSSADASKPLSGSLLRQAITLTNNRSAMYEKGGVHDLALVDCDSILNKFDMKHTKARIRKLRILESNKRFREALVEVCALQLVFLQENRDQLRMGIQVTPPIPQTKLEELMEQMIPEAMEEQLVLVKGLPRPLPSKHTIVQLLKSFTGYNAWMASAAKDGSVSKLTSQMNAADGEIDTSKKASLLYRRGRRHAFDKNFQKCKEDFEEAYTLVKDNKKLQDAMVEDDFCRLLEWVGMVRHWTYDLSGALKCYERCSDLEPINAELLVKRAGVKMDGGHHDDALELFDTALGLDPDAVDALLHRGNLRMLQQRIPDAKIDLERCLQLRPDHLLARLRLATVKMSSNDLEGAKQVLSEAERIDPNSSEVHSYRGEIYFTTQEFQKAREEFDKAIKCEKTNPTPYVNAALAVMNTPMASPQQPPDVQEAIRLLEKSIEIDPQFQPAYVHLGQLKLSMATDLKSAQEVVILYDQGLGYCRVADEMKDLVSMRLLTVAQVDAAKKLKMETLNMQ